MEEQRSSKKSVLIIVLVLAAVIVAGIVGYNALKGSSSSDVDALGGGGNTISTPRDAFSLAHLNSVVTDEEGNDFELVGIAGGKPLVVNFWATWCPHCVEEMSDFQDAFDTYGDRVAFAMLDATDGTRETVGKGSEYVRENGFTLPIYYDVYRNAVRDFGVTGFPSTAVFDENGTVVYAQAGKMSRDQLFALLENLAR